MKMRRQRVRMFDDFPDLVTLEVVTGEDDFNNPITTSTQVNARRCKDEKTYNHLFYSICTDINTIFHFPLDTDIKPGYFVDGSKVKSVSPIRGVDNVYHFIRVVCQSG